MFFWNSLAFLMIQRMLAIWSLVPLPFLKPAWTSGSSQFMYCWSLAWRILSITLLRVRWVQLCGSLSILWHCLSLVLEWKLTFSSPVTPAEFSKFASILSAALSQHHLLGFEIAQLEFHHLHYSLNKWLFLESFHNFSWNQYCQCSHLNSNTNSNYCSYLSAAIHGWIFLVFSFDFSQIHWLHISRGFDVVTHTNYAFP